MKRSDFLALIPTLSSIPFLATKVSQSENNKEISISRKTIGLFKDFLDGFISYEFLNHYFLSTHGVELKDVSWKIESDELDQFGQRVMIAYYERIKRV